MLYKLNIFQIITMIMSIIVSVVISMLMLLSRFNIYSLLFAVVAICLVCFYLKVSTTIKLLEDGTIVSSGFIGTSIFSIDDICYIRKSVVLDVIIIRHKHGFVILLRRMKDVESLLCEIRERGK